MLKKIWDKIRLTFYYFIGGMVAADKIVRGATEDGAAPVGGIEQQQEQQSVYKDLLRGEITQEVLELRHQMYYVERKSHEYEYAGGGHAKKRNSFFDYQGKAERSDGYPIKIVQENKEIAKGLSDTGIHVTNDDKIIVEDSLESSFKNAGNFNADYTIKCTRSFMPRFRIEQYTTKLVVKDVDAEHALLDFYIPQYRQQFNNISKLAQSELDKIYQGYVRSDFVTLDSVSFSTKNAYGANDMTYFEYDDIKFDDIIKFDGHYVLRFYCHVVTNGKDEVKEKFYNKEMAEKYETHAPRENAVVDYEAEAAIMARKKIDLSDEQRLLDELNAGNTED